MESLQSSPFELDIPIAKKKIGVKIEIRRGIGGQLFGKLKGLLPKKTDEKPSSQPGKDAPFFSSTTEVKTINTEPVSAEVFEIPTGYVKK